ncbi:carboxylesterase 1D-like [Ptychodera flava]|uniref:carboxylesterase 1D-like n=1 Tax=Ptychodera flava TaxID=63121 RepID=UPI00396A24DB
MLFTRFAVFLAVSSYCAAVDPLVEIRSGILLGTSVEFSHKDVDVKRTVNVFKGIPYAEPPVGELRFRPPQPKVSWEGEYNATYYRSICIQPPNPFLPIEGKQDEDCLFLNVYAPKTTQSRKLPVMVWIHGGALVVGSGSGDFYDGTVLAAVGDVVVVTFNYRLGALGFFVTGDEHATGNYGLYDQIAALQWIQTNIEAFGGDPNKVTVFGESAGSISAEFLLLSPLTDGLFHRVILQSGTATMAGFTGSDSAFHNTIAHGLGKIVGCEKDTSDELVACLRSVEADDFRNSSDMSLGLIANVTGLGEELTGLPFPPFVDDKLIKQHPVDTIREKAFTKTNK